MLIPKIDYVIEQCLNHLSTTETLGSPVESYLTRYLNIIIYAAFEDEIKKIIVRTIGEKYNDPILSNYLNNSLNKLCRSIKSSEIAGLLGYFSPEIKERFTESIKIENVEIAFNNIVISRHKIAHEEGINLTMQELISHYHTAHILLDAIVESLE